MSELLPDQSQPVPLSIVRFDQASQESGRLPFFLTPFIGRNQQITSVCDLLTGPAGRLINLTGPGGVGKTRLALAIARHVEQEFADGVTFIDLSPIRDPDRVLPAVAYAIGLRETVGKRELAQQLPRALATRQMLLVLDNFEQVTQVAPEIADLLGECADLKILVTSRAALGLSREQIIPVPPLELPDRASVQDLPTLAKVESVALFVRRAQAADPSFALTNENAAAVAQICSRLDGLPLALELAAARTKMLSPVTLSGLLERSLPLLIAGPRDAPDRQRTLRETLAWSYNLLAPAEQALFRGLAVFSGGFSLDAVEAMSASINEAIHQSDGANSLNGSVLDQLETLVAQSLVQSVDTPLGEQRFNILETIREFGLELLRETGEVKQVRDAHATFFLTLSERDHPEQVGTDMAEWLARIEAEYRNCCLALSWALESSDVETGMRLSAALCPSWKIHGHVREGYGFLERTLSIPGSETAPPAIRARVLAGLGELTTILGNYDEATSRLEESLKIRRELGDRRGCAAALLGLGAIAQAQGSFDRAATLFAESLALSREEHDHRATAAALNSLAIATYVQGDRERAIALFEESLAAARQTGSRLEIARALGNLGNVAADGRDTARAVSSYQEGLSLYRELGDKRGIALCLYSLAVQAIAASEDDRVIDLLVEALELFADLGDRNAIAEVLEVLALPLVERGRAEIAARLIGSASAIREELGAHAPTDLEYLTARARTVAAAKAALGERRYESTRNEGRYLPVERAVAEAVAAAGEIQPPRNHGSQSRSSVAFAATGYNLTRREKEVLELLAAGHSNSEIADELSISALTVKTHVSRILTKLELPSRAAAVTYVHRHGPL